MTIEIILLVLLVVMFAVIMRVLIMINKDGDYEKSHRHNEQIRRMKD